MGSRLKRGERIMERVGEEEVHFTVRGKIKGRDKGMYGDGEQEGGGNGDRREEREKWERKGRGGKKPEPLSVN